MPLIASNRIGVERGQKYEMTFYGSSFIAGPTGEKLTEADRSSEAVITATIDLEQVRAAPRLGCVPRPPAGPVRADPDAGRSPPCVTSWRSLDCADG